jgi:hypothetical protein
MATAPTPTPAPDAHASFVGKLVADPRQPPNTLLLTGFLGASSDEGHTRLYFDPQLSDYVEIPDDAILHKQDVPAGLSPLGASYVWVRRDATLIHGPIGPDRLKASFLEGRVARDHAAAAAAMPHLPQVTSGVERLLANVSRTLNRFGVPFRFKCLDAAQNYVRLDAAVLYVARRHDRLVRELLDELAAGLDSRHLGDATPLFARRLRPGVGQAEDPAGGESFGQHRCRIVAEGLWNAYAGQAPTREARLACVVAQFARYGLSLRRPHLNAGSTLEDD